MSFRKLTTAAASAAALLSAQPLGAGEAFVDVFDRPPGEPDWRISEYAHPGGWMHTRWDRESVEWRAPGALTLRLKPEESAAGNGKSFASGEALRRKRTHFGRYEVVMQAAKGTGLNSAFFTYTGPHRNDPHDEIDFEFLGKDTTKVWLNYYVDGKPQIKGPFPLGFDAAEAAHHYVFEWDETSIRWYADGRLLHAIGPEDPPPPQSPQQIYLSLWAGSPQWLGRAAPDTDARAIYHCVAFTPADAEPSPPLCAP